MQTPLVLKARIPRHLAQLQRLGTDVCSSSFQGNTGDLEELGEKTKEAQLASLGSGEDGSQPPLVAIFSFV